MAFKAVFVVLENLFTDEITRDGPGQRREEVLIAFGIPLDVPLTGILGLQGDHYQGEYRRDSRPPQTDPPLDSSTGQPVEDEEPDHDKGDKDMYPPDDRTCDLIAYVDDPLDPHQDDTGHQQDDATEEPRTRRVPLDDLPL